MSGQKKIQKESKIIVVLTPSLKENIFNTDILNEEISISDLSNYIKNLKEGFEDEAYEKLNKESMGRLNHNKYAIIELLEKELKKATTRIVITTTERIEKK